ncbi:MAG: hypothetical protein COU06_01185 [Candidatus Harrisonbacteria bacterium CG10_big_fil_rev_8_21_14_0_10_38_8]|uniref:Uncharacterized protein n=1 Tax=Candidatus Harrisonbacteria bacterium CG10_big_fil_rev_8_21_14_0_10_38_8 TaxID=1974582 RepID=A0A2M6WKC5_9BACT|nr:MAG: hypothetical protein COU06_01185 [Candidatus Harrisonbacteria bacterium CG10_big_fil_rev_8_21_14_0_10_38_8]
MRNKQKILISIATILSLALIITTSSIVESASKGFIPIQGEKGGEIAFGGAIVGITPCFSPYPGFLLKIVSIGGDDQDGALINIFVKPKSVKIYPYGQFLSKGPFVIGGAEKTSVSCPDAEGDNQGNGRKLRSIASYLP